jgi:hypothetical protein
VIGRNIMIKKKKREKIINYYCQKKKICDRITISIESTVNDRHRAGASLNNMPHVKVENDISNPFPTSK